MSNGQTINDDNRTETSKLEFDPFGSNIGFDGSLYNSGTPATDNHDLIKGFQKFQGAAGQTFKVDGIAVTQDYFLETLNSNRFGGIFGLLEKSARASKGTYLGTTYGYQDLNGRVTGNLDRAGAFQMQSETHGQINQVNWYAIDDSSWAVNWAMIPTEQQDNYPKVANATSEEQSRFNSVWDAMKKRLTKACVDALGGQEAVDKALKDFAVSISTSLEKPTNPDVLGNYDPPETHAYHDHNTGEIVINAYGGFFAQENRGGFATLKGRNGVNYKFTAGTFTNITSSGLEPKGSKASVAVIAKNLETFNVFSLLHELGHKTRKFLRDYYENDKETTRKMQAQHNDAVIKGCFKVKTVSTRGPFGVVKNKTVY
jgi:hypothetical protein